MINNGNRGSEQLAAILKEIGIFIIIVFVLINIFGFGFTLLLFFRIILLAIIGLIFLLFIK